VLCTELSKPIVYEINTGKNMSLTLTTENVENVLDELRPYLMSDGGNVELVEIEGPIVRLRLQGACGSCPSSAMTLRMGIERKLKEEIPEIDEIEQVF
jgi:Fe-S cluster biogenesis protein NfuA